MSSTEQIVELCKQRDSLKEEVKKLKKSRTEIINMIREFDNNFYFRPSKVMTELIFNILGILEKQELEEELGLGGS